MSRVAKLPIIIPTDVEVKLHDQNIYIQGPGGKLTQTIHGSVRVKYAKNKLTIISQPGWTNGWALAGTMRALLNNMVIGVTRGFTKKLQLVGIGYRIVIEGNRVNLFLGFSHMIDHQLPIGVTAECPSQTEIILRSADKQLVGQVAADLRSYRRPDPYKGKGIRYANEAIYMKETKKK